MGVAVIKLFAFSNHNLTVAINGITKLYLTAISGYLMAAFVKNQQTLAKYPCCHSVLCS